MFLVLYFSFVEAAPGSSSWSLQQPIAAKNPCIRTILGWYAFGRFLVRRKQPPPEEGKHQPRVPPAVIT